MNTRVGIGYDSHRFAAGRPLRIGGVTVPHTHGLVGHSDGDVALHALIDALLGAAALGDIGQHFPDDDPQWRGMDSARLLKTVVDKLKAAGLVVGQVDITVIAERPKIGHMVGPMRAATAISETYRPSRGASEKLCSSRNTSNPSGRKALSRP